MQTQQEKQLLLKQATLALKRASGFAETLLDEPVRIETISTLSQLSTEAHAKVVALRSAAAGNDAPKVG